VTTLRVLLTSNGDGRSDRVKNLLNGLENAQSASVKALGSRAHYRLCSHRAISSLVIGVCSGLDDVRQLKSDDIA